MNQPSNTRYQLPVSRYMSIVRHGKILFRFDYLRGVVEIQTRGEWETIDLAAEVERHEKEASRVTA